jgi:hypothetical protein
MTGPASPLAACPHCGTEVIFAVDRPHPRIAGTVHRTLLCPRCSLDDPAAQDLLFFFAVHPKLEQSQLGVFQELVQQWLTALPDPPEVSAQDFEDDVAAWRRGDFDG